MSDVDWTAEDEMDHLARAAEIAGLNPPEIVLPSHHHVLLNDMRFHYVDWNGAGGTNILFLHGGNQTCRTWDQVCLSLRPEFRSVALDQRGHGRSEWSYGGHYMPNDHLGDIEALVDHLGWDKFVLVGMSMGCLNGMHYAARHADRLHAFVAIDAGPWVQSGGAGNIVSFVEDASKKKSFDDYLEAAVQFNPRRDRALLEDSLRHGLRRMADGSYEWRSDRRFSLNLEAMHTMIAELEGLLPHMTCPTLVVRGGKSEILLPEDAERFANALPDGRWIEVKNAGHAVQGDNPRDLVAGLRGFFDAVIS